MGGDEKRANVLDAWWDGAGRKVGRDGHTPCEETMRVL